MGQRAASLRGGWGGDCVPAGHLPAERRSAIVAAHAQDWRAAMAPTRAPVPRRSGFHRRVVGSPAELKGCPGGVFSGFCLLVRYVEVRLYCCRDGTRMACALLPGSVSSIGYPALCRGMSLSCNVLPLVPEGLGVLMYSASCGSSCTLAENPRNCQNLLCCPKLACCRP